VSTLRALTRNISWNYVQAGTNLIVAFLLTPIVLEHLGEVGFGVWVLLKALLFYLAFLDLGFYNALVKYVAEDAERNDWRALNGLLRTVTSVLALAGLGALALSLVIAWLVVPHAFNIPSGHLWELRVATVLLGVDLLIAFPTSVLAAVLEGRQRFDILSGVTVVATVLLAAATVVGLRLGYGILALVGIEILGTLLTTLSYALLLRRLYPEIRPGFGPLAGEHLRRIRGYSTWTSLNEILAEGSTEVEKLLIPVLLSVSLLTPYALICTVAAAIFLAVEPITDTFFPLSSAYDAKDDRVRLRALLIRGTKLVMAISLPIAVLAAAYGEPFILAWIGPERGAVPGGVMPLVVASFTVTAFIMTGTTILLALARVREVFWMGIAELALAVALVLLTVPRYRLVGLAGSLLAANLLVTFLWIVPAVSRLLEQPVSDFLFQSLLRPLAAAVPMAVFIAWMECRLPGLALWEIASKAGFAGCIYLAAFYLVSLTPEERALCSASLRNR
jgi:O-antigen/teichoic acid export membrane protein